jgi:hypothetical protein
MADPITKVGAKAAVSQTEGAASPSTGKKFSAEAPKDSPEMSILKELAAPDRKQMEHELRVRIERAGNQKPEVLFRGDMDKLSARLDSMQAKRVPPSIRAELEKVEARYRASQAKLEQIPETNNLRDLLKMQTELYEMGESVELLSKVIDSAVSGVKQTLQMQV